MALGARSGTRADTVAFLTCLALSLTALALPESLREPLAGAIRSSILRPLLAFERRSVRTAGYRQDLDVVRAERDSFARGATQLPTVLDENARLRGLLGLAQRLGSGYVAAEVLHQAGVSDGLTLVLSAGRAEGIAAMAPVVATGGLVGMVQRVDAHTSVAMAWTHPDFRASAMAPGTGVFGIVAARRGGRVGELMELHGVAYREQLQPGQLVVTSGLGGVFPRGIPLGTVQGVLGESAGWERTWLVRPAVHPADAIHVMVLARARAADTLATVFADTTGPRP